LIGKNDFELFDPETAAFFVEKDADVLRQKQAVRSEETVSYRMGDG
jgi:hypothetical protein